MLPSCDYQCPCFKTCRKFANCTHGWKGNGLTRAKQRSQRPPHFTLWGLATPSAACSGSFTPASLSQVQAGALFFRQTYPLTSTPSFAPTTTIVDLNRFTHHTPNIAVDTPLPRTPRWPSNRRSSQNPARARRSWTRRSTRPPTSNSSTRIPAPTTTVACTSPASPTTCGRPGRSWMTMPRLRLGQSGSGWTRRVSWSVLLLGINIDCWPSLTHASTFRSCKCASDPTCLRTSHCRRSTTWMS